MRRLTWSLALVLVGCAPPNKAKPYPGPLPPDGTATTTTAQPDAPTQTTSRGLVRYFEREIDLEPFLVGFPYGRFMPSLRTGKLFYLSLGDRYTLRMLDLSAPGKTWDLARGEALGDEDWSKRSLWSVHHHGPSDTLWLHADAKNDEQMNLWKLDPKSGALEQVTKHDYVYGYGFPVHRGGPLNYANEIGLFNVVQAMKRFAQNPLDDAAFWKPAPLLAKLAAEGKTFQ